MRISDWSSDVCSSDLEVVQDVYRAEQYLDRLAERQVQVVPLDDDIILPVWILRVQTQGVVGVHVPAAGRAQPPVFPREPITPLPLLPHDLELGRAFRNRDELVPYEQAGGQPRRDPCPGPYADRPLQLLALRLVCRTSSRPMVEAEDAVGRSEEHTYELQ